MIAKRMQRLMLAVATGVFVVMCASVAPVATAASRPACYDFTNAALYPTLTGSTTEISNRIKAVQDVLEYEGYSIASAEKSPRTYGETTAAAVVASQQKNLAAIKRLGSSSSYKPTGYVDAKYAAYLQATYGCDRAESVRVTAPNGGETVMVGSDLVITWTTASTIKSSAKVDVYLVDESGSTERSEKIGSVKNSKRHVWKVPRTLGGINMTSSKSAYRIKIVTRDGESDESDARFTIAPASEGVTVIAPTAGSMIAGTATTTKITANSVAASSRATVRLVRSNGSNAVNLVSTNVGRLQAGIPVTIPADTNAGTYKIQVEVVTTNNTTITELSPEFSVLERTTSVQLNGPRGTIQQGASTTTTWTFQNLPNGTPVVLRLVDADGDVVTNLVTSGVAVNAKKATFKIPTNVASGEYTVRLEASIAGGATVVASSPTFSVQAPNLTPRVENVVAATTSARVGTSFDVTWSFANLPTATPVTIKLVDGNREVANLVTSGLALGAKKRTVSIPTFISPGDYAVKVTANPVGGSSVSATSGEFEIRARDAAEVTVSRPDGESVLRGSSLSTTWNYAGMLGTVPTVIRLVDTDGDLVTTLVSRGPAISKKTATFKIPTTVAAGTYKVRVDANIPGGATISGTSPAFTVTEPDMTPRLEITRPTGGIVQSGKATTTTWTFSNIVSSTPVVISLVSASDNAHVANLVTSNLAVKAKTKSVTIPSATVDGTYKLKFVANVAGGTSVTSYSSAFTVDKP